MATEYRLSYTASDIDERLRKVDEIDSLKNLVGTTPVADQISDAIGNIDTTTDTTLTKAGQAADAQTVGDKIADLNTLVGETSVESQISDAINNIKIEVDDTLTKTGQAADAQIVGDKISNLNTLVGETPVAEQISNAIDNIEIETETDTTLKVSGVAADAKAVGDAIADIKVETDATLKVSGAAADAKVTGDAITNLNTLVGDTPVADQIAEAIVDVYVQDEEPTDAPNGSIWVDTDADGASTTSGKTSANVYLVDARTSDISTVDFSKYAVGDIVVVTLS